MSLDWTWRIIVAGFILEMSVIATGSVVVKMLNLIQLFVAILLVY
jgi:hypothetical protein